MTTIVRMQVGLLIDGYPWKNRGIRRSDITMDDRLYILMFLFLLISWWVVAVSLMCEKTIVGVAVFVVDKTSMWGFGSDGFAALLSACLLVRCCSHQYVFTWIKVLF